MKPFKKILVPVDFSPHSDEALGTAIDLSKQYEGAITLVHVFQPISDALPAGFVLYTPPVMTDLLTRLEGELKTVADQARKSGARELGQKVLTGDACHEIVTLAQQGKYDLIVMGTHGRTGVKHALLGSVAEKVVRKAPCPVLTVRAVEQEQR